MAGFEEWYAIYPKHVGRGEAEKAYPKAIADIQAADKLDEPKAVAELLRLTQKQLPSLATKEKQFQKNPAKWLNAKGYRDEIYAVTSRTNGKPLANVGSGVVFDPTTKGTTNGF